MKSYKIVRKTKLLSDLVIKHTIFKRTAAIDENAVLRAFQQNHKLIWVNEFEISRE